MRLKSEPTSEPLHISVKQLFVDWEQNLCAVFRGSWLPNLKRKTRSARAYPTFLNLGLWLSPLSTKRLVPRFARYFPTLMYSGLVGPTRKEDAIFWDRRRVIYHRVYFCFPCRWSWWTDGRENYYKTSLPWLVCWLCVAINIAKTKLRSNVR